MRECLLIVLLIFSGTAIFGQESVALTSNAWQKKNVAVGLIWYSRNFDSLNALQEFVNVLEMDQKRLQLKVVYDEKELKTVRHRAFAVNGIAAVNGNFFNPAEGGSVCFFKFNNKVVDTSRTDLGERLFLDELDDGAICFGQKGIEILACPAAGWKQLTSYPTILSAGPMLLKDGKEMPLVKHSFNDKRYSRTGIGITKEGYVLIVTVDGHLPGSAGMRMDEFQTLLRSLGCIDALNLDGGGSTLMWIKGQANKGIVSRYFEKNLLKLPTGTERQTANALVITLFEN